jgi:hypothetical protein
MTARWSGAARKPKAKAQRWRVVSMSNVGGFPTALGGQSPKGMFSRVLVTRTSVVEASSRHSGTATEERRKAVTRRSVQRTRRVLTWNGVGSHSRARQRCYGQAKAARLAQAPRLQVSIDFRWPFNRVQKSRSWKARGISSVVGVNRAHGISGSRLSGQGAVTRGLPGPAAG